MHIYLDQIEKRKHHEQVAFAEAMAKASRRMGLHAKKAVPQNEQSAIRQILDALGIVDYELQDSDITTPEQQLTGILRSHGVMMRKVMLRGKWWRESIGPILGYDKEGRLLALLPSAFGLSYKYRDKDGNTQKINSARRFNEVISNEAYTFTKSLPLRKLTVIDLVRFSLSVISKTDYLLLVLAALAVILLGMFIPMANKLIFDSIIPAGDSNDLLPVAGLLIGAAMGTLIFSLVRNLYTIRLQHTAEINIHNAVMARTFLLTPQFFAKNSSGELTSKLENLTALCRLINENTVAAVLNTVLSVVYIVQLWHYGHALLWPALAIIAIQMGILALHYRAQAKMHIAHTKRTDKLNGLEFNMLAGIQKMKLTGSETRGLTRWLEAYTKKAQLTANPVLSLRLYPALLALLNIGGTAVLFFFTLKHQVSMSDYIAFSSAFGMMTAALMLMDGIVPDIAVARSQYESVSPILEAVPEMEYKAPQVGMLTGQIEISNLSFRYDNDMPLVLNDLSLKIKPGEYVGIAGKSGCGKSTLMRLLLGFEKPQKGAIYYDHYDLAKIDKTSLRRRIGCCLQNGRLFTGDLFHNITITAPWSTHEEAWEALRLACIDDDVRNMPMQLHTVISDSGGGFSGGQKQRLLIARALISKPSILFFDEATSALDNISQKQVSENLDSLHCTRIVIAHRLSTIRHCDRIIVLDAGRIAEEGTFEELMAKKGLFYEMSLRQL